MDASDAQCVIELGDFCQFILADPRFNLIINLFERHQMQQLLATKPDEGGERERIYNRFNGCREFLTHIKTMAMDGEAMKPAEPINEHTPVQEDPDDVVLDIYRDFAEGTQKETA